MNNTRPSAQFADTLRQGNIGPVVPETHGQESPRPQFSNSYRAENTTPQFQKTRPDNATPQLPETFSHGNDTAQVPGTIRQGSITPRSNERNAQVCKFRAARSEGVCKDHKQVRGIHEASPAKPSQATFFLNDITRRALPLGVDLLYIDLSLYFPIKLIYYTIFLNA